MVLEPRACSATHTIAAGRSVGASLLAKRSIAVENADPRWHGRCEARECGSRGCGIRLRKRYAADVTDDDNGSFADGPQTGAGALTHLDAQGRAHMVDVSAKAHTERVARAEAQVLLTPALRSRLFAGDLPKGEALVLILTVSVVVITHDLSKGVMACVFLSALLALFRKRLRLRSRTWRLAHTAFAFVIVAGTARPSGTPHLRSAGTSGWATTVAMAAKAWVATASISRSLPTQAKTRLASVQASAIVGAKSPP